VPDEFILLLALPELQTQDIKTDPSKNITNTAIPDSFFLHV
jgi:hypothetical protein